VNDEWVEGLWYQWSPANAENFAYADVASAVGEFESLDYPAGHAATAWLKEDALLNHPATLTYVLLQDGRIEGFFAIVSGSVTLKQSHRQELAPDQEGYLLSPTQGASVVAWLAKHHEAVTPGYRLMDYAVSIALDVAKRQGTVAFVLDPYDDDSAAMWIREYGFKRSQTEVRVGQRRLWLPLHSQ
jgi:hypothetical protein